MRTRLGLLLAAMLLSGCAQAGGDTANADLIAKLPLAARANPANWPEAHSPAAISDPATEAKITDLLARMTLRQKVGQLMQADISAIKPSELVEYPLGSILAGGNSGPYGNERADAAEWDQLVEQYRAASRTPAANGIGIPIIFGVDAVHGHSNLPGATIFPQNIGLGAAHDPDMIEKIGAATAAEVAGSGIEWTFAPTLAVPQNSRWGRTYEGYSSDPKIVAAYSKHMVLGLQGALQSGKDIPADHVAGTAKHFLADGGTQDGRDQGDAVIPESELVAIHAQGYPPAIDAGVLTVMASFSSWNGAKNHGNPTLLTDVLKHRMGFEGFVVGDWNAHEQIEGCTVIDCPRAIEAGLDMYMVPEKWKGLFNNTLREAQAGKLPLSRINDAVRRILRVKYKLGLMQPNPETRRNFAAIGAPAHLALAREAVSKSLVLLKNNGSVLPVKPGAKVLVTGPGADSMAMQSGGWTISWQGTDVTNSDFPKGATLWKGIDESVKAAGGTAVLSPDGSYTARPDVAIVVYGEMPYAEYQGDVPTLAYQPLGSKDLALLKKLHAQGIPVVSVFLSGRPLFTNPEINASDAFVAAWLPGSQGGYGVADVLIAGRDGKTRRDFTGNLSFPWPRNAVAPVTSPQFPLGYGMTYAAQKDLPALPEAPGLDLKQAINAANFFAAGRTRLPWALRLTDAGGDRQVENGATASPDGAVKIHPVDVRAQEDGKQFSWSAKGAFSINGPPANLTEDMANDNALKLEWRIDARGAVPTVLALAGTRLNAAKLVANAPLGKVIVSEIPLKCFAAAGAKIGSVDNALKVEGGAGFKLTLLSANIGPASPKLLCLPPAPK